MGLGLVGWGCFWVWGWWVGVGWAWFVLDGLGLVRRGECWQVWNWLVGVGVGRSGFGLSGLGLVHSSWSVGVCAVGREVGAFEWVGRCSVLLVRDARWLRR